MTSREIAEITGKRHADVLRDIRSLRAELDAANLLANAGLRWHCELGTYVDAQGKDRDQYRLDKSTTLTLLTGYRADLRMKVIQRWQELEAAQTTQQIPQSFADALQLAADQQRIIEAQARDNALLNTIIDNEFGYCSILRAAQHLGISENAFKWQPLKKATLAAGLEIKRVPSPRYAYQNLYPIKMFEQVYPQYDFSGLQPEAVATRATKLLSGQVMTVAH